MLVSVIVPIFNEHERLVNVLLPHVSEHAQQGDKQKANTTLEWIFVDGGSNDGSIEVISAMPTTHCCRLIHSQKGRARQMNAGAADAAGKTLLFLHGDCLLPHNFMSLIDRLIQATWGCFLIQLQPRTGLLSWVEYGINWRVKASATATGDQAIFVSASLFRHLGGYAAIPLMEDVELSRRLKKIAKPCIVEDCIRVDSRRWLNKGTLYTIGQMWFIQLCYRLGASPHRLHRWYYK